MPPDFPEMNLLPAPTPSAGRAPPADSPWHPPLVTGDAPSPAPLSRLSSRRRAPSPELQPAQHPAPRRAPRGGLTARPPGLPLPRPGYLPRAELGARPRQPANRGAAVVAPPQRGGDGGSALVRPGWSVCCARRAHVLRAEVTCVAQTREPCEFLGTFCRWAHGDPERSGAQALRLGAGAAQAALAVCASGPRI